MHHPPSALNPLRMCIGVALLLATGLALAQPAPIIARTLQTGCPPDIIEGQSGPWDYRKDRWPAASFKYLQGMLENVEFNHFPPHSEALVRPKIISFTADLTYTLQRWPNHHRALNTLVRLGERFNSDAPQNADRTIDCWFDRAVRMYPDDAITRGLYADYLRKRNRIPEAQNQMRVMTALAGTNPLTHFNAGMLYLDLKMYSEALQHAHQAQALGLSNIDGLRTRLAAVNQWRDAATVSRDSAAPGLGAVDPASPASPASAAQGAR